MKSIFYIILIFTCCKVVAQDTLSYSTLNNEQYKTWKGIEEKWLTEKYYPFLKKNKIKLNCANCYAAYVMVAFKRDSANTTYTILRNKKCGDEFKGKQLTELKNLLQQIILPEEFKNTILKSHLGSVLKC